MAGTVYRSPPSSLLSRLLAQTLPCVPSSLCAEQRSLSSYRFYQTTSIMNAQEELKKLEGNPFFAKYAQKIQQLQR
ncbi:unnamed protein product [Cyprideis torosa]|uniref:Uncharacterized protein n=1 Tax=Cyprideis torosa TaxID=163714 RepID=A0A7R8WEB9_9CRUS|nr:unnamed protein product [Cyprideis torosa]CAG0895555.1 unnamed protein product [Cyprideis torosa]